jgi:hypothetical protein
MNLFGNSDALIGSMDLLFGAIFVLGAFITRKTVNDSMGRGFSVIGSSAAGCLTYIIMDSVFGVMKYSFGVGMIAWLAAGFFLCDLIQDGESS